MIVKDVLGVPVRKPRGSGTRLPVAYAQVDPEDFSRINDLPWILHSRGYAMCPTPDRGLLLMHREVLQLVPGDKLEVDHRNGDPLDNRRANLRLATRQQQGQNVPSHRDGTSRFRGVCWDKRRSKWRATILVDGRQRHVGYFGSELAAAEAVRRIRVKVMPFAMGGLER